MDADNIAQVEVANIVRTDGRRFGSVFNYQDHIMVRSES